ncbi:MAG: ATP-binding cassette domain-containing protein, partial [Treponema sp.]|nr:ATP-binding cassette domain-containing protein [Treponema sp.]
MDIALSGVHKRYTYKTVLSGISMDFPGGKIHALLGENGAGKSTTAAILSGSLQPDAGTVRINGVPVTLKNERDAVRRGIVMVRQRPLLADSITVRENIVLGSEYGAETHRWNKKARQAEIAALLARLNPPLTAKTLAADLGGDSRFYTAFIAALIRRPQVLLLDEPSALLDWEQRRQLYAYIRELSQSGMNVIIITHSREEAALYTDTVTVLAEGMVAARYADSSTYVPSEPIMQN